MNYDFRCRTTPDSPSASHYFAITMSLPPPLLYANTHNADMLYFGRVEVHDPFIAFGAGSRKVTIQSSLEFGRVKRTGDFDVVLSYEEWLARARQRHGDKAGIAEIIATAARKYGLRTFRVPANFPA